ncbi:MAG TPA: hypothetical protein VLJ59_00395 [Mycobacteriales bacterium]|nr:hypothetical protein [Mycobacteriales bacterium]
MPEATPPADGRMSWSDAVAGPFAATTCLWQDLDGLHVEAAPELPPRTSHLWGWTATGRMVRVRLDGDTAYVATCEPTAGQRTEPWNPEYGRVLGAARQPTVRPHLGKRYVQVIVDGIADGAGPITFIRPANGRA